MTELPFETPIRALSETPTRAIEDLSLLSFSASARELNCSRNAIAWLVKTGRLQTVALTPRCRRIPRWALERYVHDEEGC
jgi:hypothetical protein